jgi:hypothetical protein
MKMKLYYVAYDYRHELEMISGPYGTHTEASNQYEILTRRHDDEKLKIVSQSIEVIEE